MTKLARRVARRQQKTERTALWLERQRKQQRNLEPASDRWESYPTKDNDRVARWEPTKEKPHSWYMFCVEMKYAYERVGEHLAALVYWTMRFLDEPNVQPDPTTEKGYKELCAYWDYKASWFEGKYL